MKNLSLFVFFIFFILPSYSFSSPKTGFNELLTLTEENPGLVIAAQQLAISRNLPVSIIAPERIMIHARSIENGNPVYIVITDFRNIYNGSYTAFYDEIIGSVNINNSRIDYGNGRIVDNSNSKEFFYPELKDNLTSSKVLMIPESSRDRVFIFDSFNGDLIDSNFIPTSSIQLSTPIHALQRVNGTDILVSDQISDVVQRFDQSGIYQSVFAPSGGLNNSILDNIRGMAYRPNNNLLVTVGSGLSTNTIQEFDLSGNSLGSFITTGITSPFGILYLQNNILVSCSSAPNDVANYDLNGNFIAPFHSSTNLNFAEQMIELDNKNIVVAGFSLPSGLVILDSAGNYIRTLNVVTGNRGVYLLGNGHYLTTSGTAVYELDSASGSVIRTIVGSTGFSFRFISEYELVEPSLRLTVSLESCPFQKIFNVELRSSSSPYNLIDSSSVLAGSGIASTVTFPNAASGVGYYIVAKSENSLETWSSNPQMFKSNFSAYNFTTESSKAYGGNMVNSGGSWSFYQGNINQDESINLEDVLLVYNDAINFTSGNVITDLNCDNLVDLSDLITVFTNSSNFVHVLNP
ncbi:MAG TPA: hypothetical protein PKA90_02640 [Ignavibacteria bacterium]|nr:hypothetical protein [Ignavibacteria bacterium]HMR39306.1 hypothetical protein [Ignavibacteria bacterium]